MAGPDDSNINALLARGSGPAMLEGAQAGYYRGRAQHEAQQEQERLAARPDIPAAVAGDPAALGRVTQNAPELGVKLSQLQHNIGSVNHAKHLDAVEWSGRAADAMLKIDPSQRAAAWPLVYKQGVDLGYITPGDATPNQWNPGMESQMRTFRDMAPSYVKNRQKEELKQTVPGKAAGKGGAAAGSDEVWGGVPGKQSSAAPPEPGNVQTAAYVPPAPTGQQFTPPDANMNVAPTDNVPQGDPDTLAVPQRPPQPTEQAQASPFPPQGWQAMGHRDPQGRLVPALMNGKPVFRNEQTGELTSEPQVAAAPPATVQGSTTATLASQGAPAGGPAPAPSAPQGQQTVELGDRYSPKIVDTNPAERGGVYGEKMGPHGQKVIITGPGGGTMFKMKDGTFEEYKPDFKPPKSSSIGITPENENLHGDEFVATLPVGDRNIVNGLRDGTLLLTDLSKRAQDYNRYIALAKQADPDFDPTPGGARRRFEQVFMTGGQGGQTVLATNTASDHMKTYHDLMSALGNGDTQMLNSVINAVRRQFGDAAATNPEAARAVLATEIAKAVRGAGAINEQEQKEYTRILSSAQSPAQTQGTLSTLTNLMMGRVHAIEDRAKAVGVPDSRVNNYLSPRAREALDYIQKNPVGGGKEPPGLVDRIGSMFGGSSPKGRPPIESFGKP